MARLDDDGGKTEEKNGLVWRCTATLFYECVKAPRRPPPHIQHHRAQKKFSLSPPKLNRNFTESAGAPGAAHSGFTRWDLGSIVGPVPLQLLREMRFITAPHTLASPLHRCQETLPRETL